AQAQMPVDMAGRGNRNRLLAPLGQLQQGLFDRQLQTQMTAAYRLGQHLHGDLGEYAELAEAAGHQSGQIVPGDVLHDFAAKAQQLAVTSDHPSAEDQITHRPGPGAAWAGQTRRDHAANRSLAVEGRWLAGQRLTLFFEGGKEFDQRRTAAYGHHQVGGIVIDNAAVYTVIQDLAGDRAAEKRLAVGTLDGQRGVAMQGIE